MQAIFVHKPDQTWLTVNWLTPKNKLNFDEAHTLMSLLLDTCCSLANRDREERLREGKDSLPAYLLASGAVWAKGLSTYSGFFNVIQSTRLSIRLSCVLFSDTYLEQTNSDPMLSRCEEWTAPVQVTFLAFWHIVRLFYISIRNCTISLTSRIKSKWCEKSELLNFSVGSEPSFLLSYKKIVHGLASLCKNKVNCVNNYE